MLTEERRKELVKTVHKKAEETRIALRNLRRDANEAIKKAEKAKQITEDDSESGLEDIQN
jgi:ribosome recycling factor